MRLIFVYNADSGVANAIKDSLHKILSPSTYQCTLCDLTHSAFGEKSAWTAFRKNTKIDMVFLHKDEFEQQYSVELDYPIIVDSQFIPVISAADLKQIPSLEVLMEKLSLMYK